MAIYEVVQIGDDILREKAAQVRRFDERLHKLLQDMADTMYAAEGVGLAAPQIGIGKRVVVIDIGDGLIELINPVVIEKKGTQIGNEGCLSLVGKQAPVQRAAWVKVKAQDRFGKEFFTEGDDFLAVAFQHELDHLDGVLFVDKIIKGEKLQQV